MRGGGLIQCFPDSTALGQVFNGTVFPQIAVPLVRVRIKMVFKDLERRRGRKKRERERGGFRDLNHGFEFFDVKI